MSWTAFAFQLALALTLGSLIGAERQWRQRVAGLRTHALVSTGAAMFVLGARLMAAPSDSVEWAHKWSPVLAFWAAV
jgi:putative Mg2+ transporter-C (MgtC) family protein